MKAVRQSTTGPDPATEHMELHFTRTNGVADTVIDELIELVGGIEHADIVREMILAALKAGQEDGCRGDLKQMNATLKEMRFTSKVFSPYRQVKKVTVFGSARVKPEEPVYQMARRLGRELVAAGHMVITGGGPGIMQAINEGAGPEKSFGVNIRLPFEQKANPIIDGNPRSITYKYFFNRKVAFLKEAHAVVLFPGGFGTQDEAMETITLVQTGKRYPFPLILADVPGGTYWQRWLQFLENQLLGPGYISKTDFGLFEQAYSASEAAAQINRFYRIYHSLRYVGDRLFIRLNVEPNQPTVQNLNGEFADILVPGGNMQLVPAQPEEADEPEIAHLPRLAIDFNNSDFGRLRQLIDRLNEL